MANLDLNWQSKISKLALTFSLALFVFSICSVVIGLSFSWFAGIFDFDEWFMDLQRWQILVICGVAIFLIMTFSLLVSESWINPRVKEIQNSLNKNLLLVLATILTIIILTICYFGFSMFFTFLLNNFWIA